jgi:hypothetical protein
MNPNAVKCPLCDGQVLGDSCRTCFAPIEVVKSILSAPSKPRFIGVLGPSGVGKTVYLGMLLDLLARGRCGLRGSASGPFSIALHRNTVLALEKQRFPDKTPTEPERWSWVHCEVSSEKRKQRYELVTPDVAGEALALELDAPGAQPTIQSLIRKCSSLIILLDIVDVIAHGQTQELFALQLISYLTSLHRGARRPIPIPVAVVFTKADLCDEPIDDVAAFARSNTPQLASLCQSRLAHYEFFAAGVAGACGILVDRRGRQSLVPLRVEPRGIIEPFSWVISQLR